VFCEIKVVEFALDLDVIKTKIVSLSKKLFLMASIVSQVRFGLENTTSIDLLRGQADVEYYFWCFLLYSCLE